MVLVVLVLIVGAVAGGIVFYRNSTAFKERGLAAIPTLESIADSVRKNVFQEALNHEINIWLEAIRRKSKIEIFK